MDDVDGGLGPKPPPAVDVGARQRILDEADDGVAALHLGHQRLQDAQRPSVAVEVVVQPEAVRRNVGRRLRLEQRVELGARVHLEDSVALVHGPPDLAGEDLGRAWPRPRRDRSCVPHLLAQQLVDGHLQVLAHRVVERRAQPQVEVGEHEVEGAAVDQRLDLGRGDRVGPVVIAVADYPLVGRDLEDRPAVDVGHPGLAVGIVVPLGQPRVDGDNLDVGDLHATASFKGIRSTCVAARDSPIRSISTLFIR